MTLRERIAERRRKVLGTQLILKWSTDDRVKRVAENVFDMRNRAQQAWRILVNGHSLPAIDPALDDSIGQTEEEFTQSRATEAHAKKPNGQPVGSTTADSSDDINEALRSRNSVAAIGGRDVLEKCYQFNAADNARKMGVYPYFRPLDFNEGPEAQINGKRVTMFGSNNYLGLTTHPRIRQAASEAIERFGTSMTGSRLVNGSMKLHEEFEPKLAQWFGKESAIVFTTGYQVNLAVCSALLSNRKSVAIVDRNIHASLYDGVRLGQAAGARLVRYKHNDASSLERALQKLEPDEGALVMTDGVFSAEGELAKLDEIVPVVKKYGAHLLVDEAHALGVVGPGGKGTPYLFGVADEVDLIGGTFSKSLASIGGWLVGDRKTLDYIRHFAPSFMFAASARRDARGALANRQATREFHVHAWRTSKYGIRIGAYTDGRHPHFHSSGPAHVDALA